MIPMVAVYGWISLLSFVIPVLGPPVPNATEPRVEPAFVPNPHGRGTINVLFSCIITLGLCIWTAVHPDVIANKTSRGYLISGGYGMVAALACPEMVVSNALHQWRSAKRLHAEWCKWTGIPMGSKNDIGMEGAFFVIMRGCSVGGICDGSTGTLTATGFLELTKSGALPTDALKREIIIDKSKANSIAKLLVCLQTLWMAIQCATRLALSLPVTLLEYHVVIQVGYTIAIYAFWWQKPKDVNEPIEIIQSFEISDEDFDSYVTLESQSKQYIVDHIWRSSFDGHTKVLISAILAIPISGLHLLAWNSHFPSTLEKWIWRISSIGIGVAPMGIYIQFVLSKHFIRYIWVSKEGDPLHHRIQKIALASLPSGSGDHRTINSRLEMDPREMIFYGTMSFSFYLYLTSIILLGVVAFASIRSVPEGSYKTPVWGEYWPHF